MVQFNLSGDSTANEKMSNPDMGIGNNTTMKQETSNNVQLTLAHSLLENVTKLIDTVLNQN